jgi:ribosomal protein S6--L-glutamate ligase
MQAIRERGHQAAVLDTMAVAVRVGLGDGGLTRADYINVNIRVANGRDPNPEPEKRVPVGASERGLPRALRLPPVDALIPRIGASVTAYGLAVVRQFEATGVLTTASSRAIARSRDKLQSMQLMSQAGLPIPQTAVLAHPDMLFAAVEAVGGLPVIMKLIQGTQGRGVILARYISTVSAVLEKVRQHEQQVLVQEFIGEANGSDVRIIVVGDRCVAAMERHAPIGEFRSNLHRGGTATAVTLDARMAQLAVQAAQVHGLEVAGVDLILSDRGPLVLEVNSSPGLEGIEQATGVDVAGAIVSLLERKVRKEKRGKRRRVK